jgi:S23 ribosomal protein.
MAASGFMNLTVWQRAMELMRESYKVAEKLPHTERYGMADQMRRSALSVPSNIAEGHSRSHVGEYLNHLSIASGSLAELQTLLIAARDIGYVSSPQLARPLSLALETSRMLSALRSAVRRRGRST